MARIDSPLPFAAAAICTLFLIAAAERAVAGERSIQQQISAIESGLVPWVEVQGEPSVAWTLAQRMSFYKVPAVSVAVINEYKIEWAQAWGVTKSGGRDQVSSDTLFQAGSISKAVGAMGAMHLVQEGKLSLDANVDQELKSWKIPKNQFTGSKAVTLRELLSHSGGTTVHGFPGYDVHAPIPSLLQVLDGVPPANTAPITVETAPGGGWQYSGGGYEIIQQMMIDQTGLPFPEYMRTKVLEPLDMNHSTFQQPLPVALQGQAAGGTLANGAEVSGKWHVYPEMMAAGLWTTPSDLAKFAIALMNTTRGLNNPVISAATGSQMLTPQIDTGNAALGKMGLGAFVKGTGGESRFGHDGGNEGFQAVLMGYYSGAGAVVMANSSNGIALASEIVRAIAHEYGWPAPKPAMRKRVRVSPKLWERLVGDYQLAPGALLKITVEGQHLYAEGPGLPRTELIASGEFEYYSRDFQGQITFGTDERGKANLVILHTDSGMLTAPRAK